MSTQNPNQAEIVRALRILHSEGDTFEIRAPKAAHMGTASGYFTDPSSAAKQVLAMLDGKAPGVYVTLNPVQSDLLARAAQRIKPRADATTQDRDVTRRRWLLLDFDTQRPTGISATDVEHEAALNRAKEIADVLATWGWPAPVIADSGNGAHLLYRLDLPNDDAARDLVSRTLKVLAALVDDPEGQPIRVCLDTTVGNAGRIVKLYGTLAAKGDSTPDRHHRRAALLQVPDEAQIVTAEQLEDLSAALGMRPGESPSPSNSAHIGHQDDYHIADFGRYLDQRGVAYRETDLGQGTRRYVLDACVWNAGHTDHSAWAIQWSNGSIAVGCSHNSCQGKRLREFRDTLEPGWDKALSRARQSGSANSGRREAAKREKGERSSGGSQAGPSHDPPLESSRRAPPSGMRSDAYYGLAGDIVRALEDHTEADPDGVLVQVLAIFGAIAGRKTHFKASADRHYPNLFVVLVGDTSAGRKGMSWGVARHVFTLLPEIEDWLYEHTLPGGMSSGEGLIHPVRDYEPNDDAEPGKKAKPEPLQSDKRVIVYEGEFSSVLKMPSRDGNNLSEVQRRAWDGTVLQTLTKNAPERASGAHIAIVGNITREELIRYLSQTETANGFGNRYLWVHVSRSKSLPDGGDLDGALDTLRPLAQRLRAAIDFVEVLNEYHVMTRDDKARLLWHREYDRLTEGYPGLFGAMTARGAPQVMRLATIYALLDCSQVIRAPHLKAALAVWDYVEDSVRYIFGDALGDPTADTILRRLRATPEGVTRTEISSLFARHAKAAEIDRGLALLSERNLARCEKEESEGGRPTERWFSTMLTASANVRSAKKAKKVPPLNALAEASAEIAQMTGTPTPSAVRRYCLSCQGERTFFDGQHCAVCQWQFGSPAALGTQSTEATAPDDSGEWTEVAVAG